VSDRPAFPLSLPDLRATEALAARLAAVARQGDVIALAGPLGSGKTTFARAFIRARFPGRYDVPSPTFTLVELYDGDGPTIWHFDLFRIAAPGEAWELGIEDAFAEGISLIEWPERLGTLMPAGHLAITLDFGRSARSRVAMLSPSASWLARLEGLSGG